MSAPEGVYVCWPRRMNNCPSFRILVAELLLFLLSAVSSMPCVGEVKKFAI